MEHGYRHTIAIGVVTALVGFASSFAVVLAGLKAVGASDAQAASGLAALCVTQAIGMMWLSWRYRTPLTLAWSTPGAALLATQGYVEGGWPAAVGAFALTGALIVTTGLIAPLGRLVSAIPTPIAQAMLAGVLVPLCLSPFTSLAEQPWLVGALIVTWIAVQAVAPRWATPAAFALALAMMVAVTARSGDLALATPTFALTSPTLSLGSVLSIAVPLYIVTMASQNVPGVAVLRAAGFATPWRSAMLVTGVGTVVGAPLGGHAINLAAIAATLTGLVAAAPAGLLEAVAGLALLTTFAASTAGALSGASDRIPAALTLLLAASGVAIGGIGSAFWALVAGLTVRLLLRMRRAFPVRASATAENAEGPAREHRAGGGA